MSSLIDEFDDDGQYDPELLAILCPCEAVDPLKPCQWCLDGIAERAVESVRQYEIDLLREMWEA